MSLRPRVQRKPVPRMCGACNHCQIFCPELGEEYRCLWVTGQWGEALTDRPDFTRCVPTIAPWTFKGRLAVLMYVSPRHPTAYRRSSVWKWITRAMKNGFQVFLQIGDRRYYVVLKD